MAIENQEVESTQEEVKNQLLPSAWEERFEREINELFDDAIDRLPRFVDRNFRSFTKVMGRNLSPKTSIGDLVVGIRNMASGISEAFGGPCFETTTFTEDEIARAFEREVLSPLELEALLTRIFDEFEDDLWRRFEEKMVRNSPDVVHFRDHLSQMIDEEIAHDPKLAQAVRSGIHVGIPITLGYFLFNRSKYFGVYSREITTLGSHDTPMLQRMFDAVRGKRPSKKDENLIEEAASDAVGISGAILGSLVVGGIFEYAFNSIRDLKGSYIRQINTARYVLLYGADPSNADGRGILHIVRAIERKFDELPGFAAEAFNLWLESGVRSSKKKVEGLENISYFTNQDPGNVSIEEALEISYDEGTPTKDGGAKIERKKSTSDCNS